jgi:predicted nucleic-acid-binding protein
MIVEREVSQTDRVYEAVTEALKDGVFVFEIEDAVRDAIQDWRMRKAAGKVSPPPSAGE